MEAFKTEGKAGTKGHVHGGPISSGKYAIKTPGGHKHLGLSAELVHPHWKPIGRDVFYIHGRATTVAMDASCRSMLCSFRTSCPR